jgi:hypothetical protein
VHKGGEKGEEDAFGFLNPRTRNPPLFSMPQNKNLYGTREKKGRAQKVLPPRVFIRIKPKFRPGKNSMRVKLREIYLMFFSLKGKFYRKLKLFSGNHRTKNTFTFSLVGPQARSIRTQPRRFSIKFKESPAQHPRQSQRASPHRILLLPELSTPFPPRFC